MRFTVICAWTSLLVVAALSVSALAGTIYIKSDGTGDYPTIQAGIANAVSPGDIVLLAAGTYTGVGNRAIDFSGKAITVTSESGPDATIIDCQGLGRGFLFQNGETSASVLSGLTIKNGSVGDYGGGIYCTNSSSPTISNNIISGNSAGAGGGGGGICCNNTSSPTISNNIISGNSSNGGGGIWCRASSPTISNNTISGNSSGAGGGGIYCSNASSPTISYNTISGNSAAVLGGGMYCSNASSPTISYNTISGNSDGWYCGGCGGGIACDYSSPTISNNTISGNSGGVYCENSSPSISNTILSFSNVKRGISCAGGSNPTLTNCDIYGNTGGDARCGTDGGGNISADPLFCGFLGSGNYYLRSDSPCAPGNHSSGTLIGAWPVGCGTVSVEGKTWGAVKEMYQK